MRILYDNVSHWFSSKTALSETDQWGEDFTSWKWVNATKHRMIYCFVDCLGLRKWRRKCWKCRLNLKVCCAYSHPIVNSTKKMKQYSARIQKPASKSAKKSFILSMNEWTFNIHICCFAFVFLINVRTDTNRPSCWHHTCLSAALVWS